MIATVRTAIILLALVLLSACASDQEAFLPADPDAFALGIQHFESAYDELNEAIVATPSWYTNPKMSVRVKGLAELAIHRANKLRRFIRQDLVSEPAIALMEAQVKKRAMIHDPKLSRRGGSFLEEPEKQIQFFAEETAYFRLWQQIDVLEEFASANHTTPWIDTVVLATIRQDINTVINTSATSANSWRRINFNSNEFADDQARVQALLDHLDGKAKE